MDCRTARLLLDFTRPDLAELQASEANALESHLGGCPECETLARAERQVDEHLGQAMRAVPVPEKLQARLLERLGVERRRLHRRAVLRAVAPLAAAALLALGVWYLWPRTPLPGINIEVISEDPAVVLQNPSAPTPELAEKLLRDKYAVAAVVPRELSEGRLNYALLDYVSLGECQGKHVPVLCFLQGDNRLRVYILSSKQFNLAAIPNPSRKDSGGYTVEIRPGPTEDVAYILVYTGNSLAPFLSEGPPPIT